MIQLYTHNEDGTYDKVNWKNIKMIPECKVKEAIDKEYGGSKECYCKDKYNGECGFCLKKRLLKELKL